MSTSSGTRDVDLDAGVKPHNGGSSPAERVFCFDFSTFVFVFVLCCVVSLVL